MVIKGCGTDVSLGGNKLGDISMLHTNEEEQLIVDGRNRDGQRVRTVVHDFVRVRPRVDSSGILQFEKAIDSADPDFLTQLQPENHDLIQRMLRCALVNQDNRPWIISKNSKTPIPILADMNKCLDFQKPLPEKTSVIIGCITNMVRIKSSSDPSTRIVDDIGNPISIDALIEKYWQPKVGEVR